MPPLISIVTVTLNDASGLRRTGESIVGQVVADFEWLIVDGGSSDGSLAVIERFGDAVTSWTSEPDGGVYDAMNRGLARARGTYVVFMNAGDRFADARSLAWLAEALRAEPGADLVFGGTVLDLPSGQSIYRPPRPSRFVRFGLPACHQAIAIRRQAHLAVPYDLNLSISAEYGAIAGLVVAGARARLLDAPIAVRHCDPRSLSERRTVARFGDFVRVQRRVLQRNWFAVGLSLARQALIHVVYLGVRQRRLPGLSGLRLPG